MFVALACQFNILIVMTSLRAAIRAAISRTGRRYSVLILFVNTVHLLSTADKDEILHTTYDAVVLSLLGGQQRATKMSRLHIIARYK